jgi:hypothetical protein
MDAQNFTSNIDVDVLLICHFCTFNMRLLYAQHRAQELVDGKTLGDHFAVHGLGPAVAETPLEQAANAAATLQ